MTIIGEPQLIVSPYTASSLITSESTFDSRRINLSGSTNTTALYISSLGNPIMDASCNLLDNTNTSFITLGGAYIAKSLYLGENLCAHGNAIIEGNLSVSGTITAAFGLGGSGGGISNLCYPIGTPSGDGDTRINDISMTTFTNFTGLQLRPQTLGCDAFQLIDKWIATYLIDSPLPPTLIATTFDTQSARIDWDNLNTVPYPLDPIRNLPFVLEMRIDYVKSSLNTLQDWSDPSVVTVQTTTNLTDSIEFFTQGISSGLDGTKWEEFVIESGVSYDVRIYGYNYSIDKGRPAQYLEVYGIGTQVVGVPNEPTSVGATPSSTTQINVSWTKPNDHDLNDPGLQTFPIIERYQVDYEALSTVRFGGIFGGSSTGTQSTALTVDPTNSNTNLTVSSLLPGTEYEFFVSAKNAINDDGGPQSDGYGALSLGATAITNYPTQPTLLQTSDANALNSLSTLRSPYSSSGGYSLDGSTNTTPIININNSNGVNGSTPIRTTITPSRRNNQIPGTTDLAITTLDAYGGLVAGNDYLANNATTTLDGFGSPVGNGTFNDTKSSLIVSNEIDAYSGSSAGFWETFQMYAQARDIITNYPAAIDEYALQLKYTSNQVGGSTVSTNRVDFYIDDLNNVPGVTNVAVIDEISTGATSVSYISGVGSYNLNAEFLIQFNISDIAHYFLRFDKLHAQLRMQTVGGSALSSNVNVAQTDIGGSHKYYSRGSNTYQTSSTLHNTSGLVLQELAEDIQFNDFSVSLSSLANDQFIDDFRVRVIPYNLYGTGSNLTGGYVDPSDGSTRQLRIDTNSIAVLKNIEGDPAKGVQTRSGQGQYPNIGVSYPDVQADGTYDHSIAITGNLYYQEELQLVNGLFSTPTVADGYKDYSTSFFFPGNPTMPDYSSIASDSNYRYTTFYFTGLDIGISSSITREKIEITINENTGLTIDTSTPATSTTHRMTIRVVDDDYPDGTDFEVPTTEGWLDAAAVIGGLGLQSGSNGTGCLDVSSTNSLRKAYLKPGVKFNSKIYIRIGLRNNMSTSFECISVRAVENFV